MKFKAIAFCRVSTTQQDYTRQVADLMPLITSDGYANDEIYIIKHKESATKNDINKRKSIAELEEVISTNPIEAVYCTEASRLARRGDVLYAVLALLEENHISLVIQTPTLLRTIENGKSNPIAHVVLAFLGQVAAQEMELKKERQKSGYAQKVKDGKVVSSRVKFGYVRENGYAVVDQEKAKYVADIFNMYLDGNSVTAIWDKYDHTGIFPKASKRTGWGKITNILRDTTYVGNNKTFKYPPIISDDLFNAVQAKMDASIMCKSKLKYVYYCQGILRCMGHTMTPDVTEVVYSYRNPEDGKTIGINMNVMDSLMWNLAAEAKAMTDTNEQADKLNKVKEELIHINAKLEGIKEAKEDITKQQEKANTLYIKGRLTEDSYNYRIEELDGQMGQLLNEEEQLTTQRTELEAYIDAANNNNEHMQQSFNYNTIINVTDDTLRQQIIKEVIEYVEVIKEDKTTFNIVVHYKDAALSAMWNVTYRYIRQGKRKTLLCVYDDNTYEDLSDGIVERIKRYERKK